LKNANDYWKWIDSAPVLQVMDLKQMALGKPAAKLANPVTIGLVLCIEIKGILASLHYNKGLQGKKNHCDFWSRRCVL